MQSAGVWLVTKLDRDRSAFTKRGESIICTIWKEESLTQAIVLCADSPANPHPIIEDDD